MNPKEKIKKNCSIIKTMQESQQNQGIAEDNKQGIARQTRDWIATKQRQKLQPQEIHIAGIASRFYCMSNAQLVCQRNIR